jgi:hypothetical protein
MRYLEDDREARKKAAEKASVQASASSISRYGFAPSVRNQQPVKPILPPVPPPTPTSNAEPFLIRTPSFEELKDK